MVHDTNAKIRKERNNLWRAKNLYRFFTGDETWIPSERAEGLDDWELFEPNYGCSGRRSQISPSKRRRLNGDAQDVDRDVQISDALDERRTEANRAMVNGTLEDLSSMVRGRAGDSGHNHAGDEDVDVSMAELETEGMEADSRVNGTHNEVEQTNKRRQAGDQDGSGVSKEESNTEDSNDPPHEDQNTGLASTYEQHDHTHDGNNNDENEEEENDQPSTTSSPPPPPRRITRALAAEAETASNPQIASPPPTSPTLSSHSQSQFEPHPIFLLPPHLAATHAIHPTHTNLSLSLAHSGLPPEELLETRKLLSLYIQKSEETIRGLENILGKLIKAKRRRDRLFEWCRSEGHVGELSDGEDWIDEGYWGLESGELRKGRDEDSGANVDIIVTGVEGEGGEGPEKSAMATANAAVVMGGRKGKRRGRARE